MGATADTELGIPGWAKVGLHLLVWKRHADYYNSLINSRECHNGTRLYLSALCHSFELIKLFKLSILYERVVVACTFQGIGPFHVSCQNYACRAVCNVSLLSFRCLQGL